MPVISDTGKKLVKSDIESVERVLSCKLPDGYIKFISQFNGGHPEPCGFSIPIKNGLLDESCIHYFYGVGDSVKHDDILMVARRYYERMPNNLLPIADDPIGNQICIALNGDEEGAIYFWNHDFEHAPSTYSNTTKLATSLDEFLLSFYDLKYESESILDKAIRHDDLDIVKKFVESMESLEMKDGFGRTMVENAAISNSLKVIEYLYERGANLRSSLLLAEENAKFFPEHIQSVQLIRNLSSKN